MKYFTHRDKKELKDYLYYGHSHDSAIEKIEYIFKDEYAKDRLNVFTVNNYDKVREKYVISGLEKIYTVNDHISEKDDVVLDIYVEDEASGLNIDEYLYLIIQMKSFEEIHIICKEIYITEESI